VPTIGVAFEMPCPNPLLFDVEVGSCVRSEQLSASAKAGRTGIEQKN
jgi:hypothetical protein